MKKVILATKDDNWYVNHFNEKIRETSDDLKARQARGDNNLLDTYEYGFIDACRELNRVFDLGLEVPKGLIK